MKIIYHPIYDGHIYVGRDNDLLMNIMYVGTAQLQDELELHMGMSYCEVKEEDRVAEYYDILKKVIVKGHILFRSFENDTPASTDIDGKYTVTEALLGWRDSLIMAGWDREKVLPNNKLKAISDAEKLIPENGFVRKGRADRWLDLAKAGRCDRIDINVKCARALIPEAVSKVLGKYVNLDKDNEIDEVALKYENIQLLEFKELTDTYNWLAKLEPEPRRVVISRDKDRLDSVLRAFHKPAAVNAQVGAHQVIPDVRDTALAPESLIWLDCNGGYNYDYPYEFLSEKDCDELRGIGITIPTEDEILAATREEIIRHLSAANSEVTIVKSNYDNGAKLPEHPLVTELLSRGTKASIVTAESVSGIKSSLPVIKLKPEAELKVSESCVPLDVVMSKSSLEKLIQFPFDFVVEKEAGLYEPDDNKDLTTVKGLVAHKVVELMVNDKTLDINSFDKYLTDALEAQDRNGLELGEKLTQPENEIELDEFKTTLKQSLTVLFGIMEENNLNPVQSELHIPKIPGSTTKLDDMTCNWTGDLDLVLKTEDGKFVIFDFKYTSSEKYKKALEGNASIQFEVYKRLFDKHSGLGEVSACAYYLFPAATLYITEKDRQIVGFKDNAHIEVVKVDSAKAGTDLWKTLVNSYNVRMEQMKNGTVEQGENMELSCLDYYNQYADPDKAADLFPLDNAYNKPKLKGAPYKASHIVLKNQLR